MKTVVTEVSVPARGTSPREARWRSAAPRSWGGPGPGEPYHEARTVEVRITEVPDPVSAQDVRSLIEQALREVPRFGLDAGGTTWGRLLDMAEKEGFRTHLARTDPVRRGFLK